MEPIVTKRALGNSLKQNQRARIVLTVARCRSARVVMS
jgi:hypothetical protein